MEYRALFVKTLSIINFIYIYTDMKRFIYVGTHMYIYCMCVCISLSWFFDSGDLSDSSDTYKTILDSNKIIV